jgi:hypothetical protein
MWSHSASELYRPSDRRLLAKLIDINVLNPWLETKYSEHINIFINSSEKNYV